MLLHPRLGTSLAHQGIDHCKFDSGQPLKLFHVTPPIAAEFASAAEMHPYSVDSAKLRRMTTSGSRASKFRLPVV